MPKVTKETSNFEPEVAPDVEEASHHNSLPLIQVGEVRDAKAFCQGHVVPAVWGGIVKLISKPSASITVESRKAECMNL